VALEKQSLAALYTTDIAREAGVSKRTFYEHFSNKDECFLALYVENSGRILETLRAAIAQPGIDMAQRVEIGAVAYLTAMQGQAPLMKRLYTDILTLGAEGMQARRRVTEDFAALIAGIYQDQRSTMPLLPALPPELVLAVIAGLNELILYKIEDGQVEHLLDLAETTKVMILGVVQGLIQQSLAQPPQNGRSLA